jgi:glutathione S-transferase
MLKIYNAPTVNGAKVIYTAEQIGLKYDYIPLDFSRGEHKSSEHMARHPLGKIPAIEHNGKALFESNTICRYLARIADSPLYGSDDYQRGVIDQWVDMMSNHPGRWLTVYYFEEHIKPLFLKQSPDEKNLKEAANFVAQQMPVVDKRLAEHEFLAGDNISIADTIGYSLVNTSELTSVDLSPYKNLVRWYEQLKNSTAFVRAAAVLA